jgi:hypothetical protein
MLWGWPLSTWEVIVKASLWLAGISGAVAAVSAFIAGYVGYELTDIVQKDADKQISETKADAARANESSERLRNETARLQSDNLSLQKIMQPRRMHFLGWTRSPENIPKLYDGLKKFAGTKAFMQVVPDFEAQMFADDILNVLKASGWDIEYVGEDRSHLSEKRFREGIAVFTLMDGSSPMTEAGSALKSVLLDVNGDMPVGTALPQPFRPGYPYFDPPISCVFIRVGLKPVTTEALEIQRRQIERENQELLESLKETIRQGRSASVIMDGHEAKLGLTADGKLIAKTPTGDVEYTGMPSPKLVMPIGGSPFLVTIPGPGAVKP